MNFKALQQLILLESQNNTHTFEESSDLFQKQIFALSKQEIIPLIQNIGILPESVYHDSSEEKLYTKVADILLAKGFQELGLQASVNKERSNCADIIAKSTIHNYSLIGDAKTFRLSRTAKNQKDFKVRSMVDWKGSKDFAVLVCPYYQYPKSRSQIYAQALDGNLCLLSWEHLVLFLQESISESKSVSFKNIWNISAELANLVTVHEKARHANFHVTGNELICKHINVQMKQLLQSFSESCRTIIDRGRSEIHFWTNKITQIHAMSKEEAIQELIATMKIHEKINSIEKYIASLEG